MAGIYIHIPFCKQACHYCNFHFSTSLNHKTALVEALQKEIKLQKNFLLGATIESIYFGGGTPSMLTEMELMDIFSTLHQSFEIGKTAEITFEANPDDLTSAYLQTLVKSPVNRLSIGVQSFFEEDLKWMNRAHDANQAIDCIHEARKAGFENFSVDLIYGSPSTSNGMWEKNLEKIRALKIPHLSSYALTVEEGTALGSWVKKGKMPDVDPAKSLKHFEMLQQFVQKNHYRHYEISNMALEGFEAVHNSNYWKRIPYLGIGPAAHSFDGKNRQWNINNNAKYIQALNEGRLEMEKEALSESDLFNEYIMTGLRCDWGISKAYIAKHFPQFNNTFEKELAAQVQLGALVEKTSSFVLADAAKFIADGVASEFFVVND